MRKHIHTFCGIFPQFFHTFHNSTFLASTTVTVDIQILSDY